LKENQIHGKALPAGNLQTGERFSREDTMMRTPSRTFRAAPCFFAIVCGLFLCSCNVNTPTARATSKPSPTKINIWECNEMAGQLVTIYASGDFNDPSLPYPIPDLNTPLNFDTLPLLPVSVVARLYDSPQAAPEYFHAPRFMVFNLVTSQIIYDATLSYNADGTVIETPPGPGGPANPPHITFSNPGETYFAIQWVPGGPGNYLLIVMDRYSHAGKIGPYAEVHACITIRDSDSSSTDTPIIHFLGKDSDPTNQYMYAWQVCGDFAASPNYTQSVENPTLPSVDYPVILAPAENSVLPMVPVTITYQLPPPSNPEYLIRSAYQILDIDQLSIVDERQPAVMTSVPESIVSEEWVPQHPGYYLWFIYTQNFLPAFRPPLYLNIDQSGYFSYTALCFIVENLPTDTPTVSPTAGSNPLTETPTATPTNTPTITPTQKPRPVSTDTSIPGPQPTECGPIAPCP
jgi:hypothetical protein